MEGDGERASVVSRCSERNARSVKFADERVEENGGDEQGEVDCLWDVMCSVWMSCMESWVVEGGPRYALYGARSTRSKQRNEEGMR